MGCSVDEQRDQIKQVVHLEADSTFIPRPNIHWRNRTSQESLCLTVQKHNIPGCKEGNKYTKISAAPSDDKL